MSHINIPKGWEMPAGDLTPESVFLDRRDFLKGTGVVSLAAAALVSGCAPGSEDVLNHQPEIHLTALEKKRYPARRIKKYKMDRGLTDERIAAHYNNFYEFSETKEDVTHHARALKTRGWTVEVGGLVNKPGVFSMDDLLTAFALEERFYRHRCVEAWAMAVPWTGFPLKALLDRVEPQSKAEYVEFTSFYQPFTAQGQLAFWQPWPYTEALRLDEAMHELTLMATGIYGHPLPKQHGAPLRLVVPWKYGFKSIKSVTRITLVDYRPATFWNTLQGTEYGFTANVNPHVPHPRWPQTKEKMIGSGMPFFTQLYNGYGKFVANLYA
ncbi:MAG: protein-methionine-sulfoxide reductase catalytic subunit MsrP [Nitrospinaceae bacterium]